MWLLTMQNWSKMYLWDICQTDFWLVTYKCSIVSHSDFFVSFFEPQKNRVIIWDMYWKLRGRRGDRIFFLRQYMYGAAAVKIQARGRSLWWSSGTDERSSMKIDDSGIKWDIEPEGQENGPNSKKCLIRFSLYITKTKEMHFFLVSDTPLPTKNLPPQPKRFRSL